MKLSTAFVLLLGAVASASAFAPVSQQHVVRSSVVLNMSNKSNDESKTSKRKRVLKKAGKIVGAAASVALATSTVPSAALAAKKVEEVTKAADITKNIVTLGAGAFAAGIGTNTIVRAISEGISSSSLNKALDTNFPQAQKNKDIVANVQSTLKKHGFGKKSLVATSLCADEVNRVLERDFFKVYGDHFSMGGLAGFPFGGITSFGAMASHIPDGGSCLVVYGPHVGIDSSGKVGTVERRGRENGGACCGSAVAAYGYVNAVHSGIASRYGPPEVPDDAQQNFVGTALLPYAAHLDAVEDKMAELPYAFYDAQKKMMNTIIQAGAGNVAGEGKIACLGGIQINTPPGKSDYFLPLSFELYSNSGELIEDMSSNINCGRAVVFPPRQSRFVNGYVPVPSMVIAPAPAPEPEPAPESEEQEESDS